MPWSACRGAAYLIGYARAALAIPPHWSRQRSTRNRNSAGGHGSPTWMRSCAPRCYGARRIPTVMATERSSAVAPILLAAASLLWPALRNGYPLVFSDTGTYLSQAIEHYAGWDRPVFYSFFLLPLHLTITTWPAIAVQALLTVYTFHLVHRALWPDASPWRLLPIVLLLAITTSLPWFVAQLMPDVFTGLLVLVLALLIFRPECLSIRERLFLAAFAAF